MEIRGELRKVAVEDVEAFNSMEVVKWLQKRWLEDRQSIRVKKKLKKRLKSILKNVKEKF